MKLTAELAAQIDLCSRCGACRAHCPVFAELLDERGVARGKVQLVGALSRGELDLTPEVKEAFALCLLCESCEAACPNGVAVHRLVQAVREELARRYGLGLKGALLKVLPSPGRLEAGARVLGLYQRSGLQALVRRTGLLRALPGQLAAKEDLLPPVELPALSRRYPGGARPPHPRFRVAYFTGCVSQAVITGTGVAVVELLVRAGAEVVLPPQTCCALPIWAAGDTATARRMAAALVGEFVATGADAVITDCGSCGHMLQRYPELLESAEAARFAGLVTDVSAFLDRVGFPAPDRMLPLRVTYHDSCHLKRGMGVWQEPRRLLQSIPGLELVEMADADRCCGGGGSFMIECYPLAQAIARHKAEAVRSSGARAVATGCPGCRVQLQHALRAGDYPCPVYHPVELLARAVGVATSEPGGRRSSARPDRRRTVVPRPPGC